MDTVRDVLDPTCPSQVALGIVGNKWTMLIIFALSDGVHRFSELRDRIAVITPKVLTQTLRALERDGLVERTVYPVVPPKVEYRLTGLGHSLLQSIAAVREWAEAHAGEVLEARERAELPEN
ncbi:helix-turn-helix domain-containing protein [Streptomyces sp. NPDC026672]|uniref:winged helix-turn-helix transcriptional regulator n=1 Tax=unclassified Streptomyces TaxID=2593676 RepID=UPI0033CD4368